MKNHPGGGGIFDIKSLALGELEMAAFRQDLLDTDSTQPLDCVCVYDTVVLR